MLILLLLLVLGEALYLPQIWEPRKAESPDPVVELCAGLGGLCVFPKWALRLGHPMRPAWSLPAHFADSRPPSCRAPRMIWKDVSQQWAGAMQCCVNYLINYSHMPYPHFNRSSERRSV